jgi:putative ABC transport system permease protein
MATVRSQELKSTSPPKISALENWTDFWSGWTYILLEPGKSPIDIQKNLDKIYQDHIAVVKNQETYRMKFRLQALKDITPGPMINNAIGPIMPWVFIYFLGGLAILILLTSCFNFTNLSIARSLTRAREIGVRKVTGAARWQIFLQFLTESIVVAFAALVMSMVLLLLVKPLILQLNFARIFHWDMELNITVYAIFIVFALVVGILAGLFPAFVLSAFQPVKVLKNLNSLKVFSRVGLRKVLLVVQFSLSLFFILSVIVMHNQLSLFISKDHGFNMQSNIMIKLNKTAPQVLKTELLKFSNIESVTAVSHVPAAGTSNGTGFKKSLADKEWTFLDHFIIDEDYLKNMELQLVAGNFFNPSQEKSNKDFIVINEEAVRKLHYNAPADAIGEVMISQRDSTEKVIIGVVEDYNHRDLTRAITPMVLIYDPGQFAMLQVRYSGTYEDAVKVIEKSWAYVNPGLKSDIKSVESEIKKMYEIVFGDLVKVLGIVAFLAIMISCLGLLGMATYTTETRIKEISIRKVLGSSSTALVILLSKGFLVVLGIAIVVGVPITFFVNNMWLELIAHHTELSPIVMIQGVAILTVFGVLTIGSQTIRATFVKPVDNLKSE